MVKAGRSVVLDAAEPDDISVIVVAAEDGITAINAADKVLSLVLPAAEKVMSNV